MSKIKRTFIFRANVTTAYHIVQVRKLQWNTTWMIWNQQFCFGKKNKHLVYHDTSDIFWWVVHENERKLTLVEIPSQQVFQKHLALLKTFQLVRLLSSTNTFTCSYPCSYTELPFSIQYTGYNTSSSYVTVKGT